MAKHRRLKQARARVLLTPECELWQSQGTTADSETFVLLTPECELWQSDPLITCIYPVVLLTPECELWQSEGPIFTVPSESC